MALAIAILALGTLFGLARAGLTGVARAEAEAQATVLAESSLEAMGTVAPLADGDVGDFDKDRFHVHATVARDGEVAANGYLVPYVLAATVSWRDGAITLRTVRLGAPR